MLGDFKRKNFPLIVEPKCGHYLVSLLCLYTLLKKKRKLNIGFVLPNTKFLFTSEKKCFLRQFFSSIGRRKSGHFRRRHYHFWEGGKGHFWKRYGDTPSRWISHLKISNAVSSFRASSKYRSPSSAVVPNTTSTSVEKSPEYCIENVCCSRAHGNLPEIRSSSGSPGR